MGWDADSRFLHPHDLVAQTDLALKNVIAVLAAAGGTPEAVDELIAAGLFKRVLAQTEIQVRWELFTLDLAPFPAPFPWPTPFHLQATRLRFEDGFDLGSTDAWNATVP